MDPTSETALRRALELQASGLIAIASGLRAAALHPPVAPADWHGPASSAYGALESRMRSRLAAAEQAVVATLQSTRLALADLGD